MANSKGKSRRVDESDEEAVAPATAMDTDGEESTSQQRTRDKGKGRAGSSTANGAQASVKREATEPVDSDQDDDQQPNGSPANEDEDEGGDPNNLDAEQDINTKRSIRKKYRDLTKGLNDERARDPDSMTAGALKAGLEKVNKLFKGVQAPAEAILDSDYLRLTGDLAMYQARKIKIGTDYFDTEDFLTKLKNTISQNLLRQPNRASQRGAGSSQRSQADADEDEEYDGTIPDPFVGWDFIGKLAIKHSLRVPPIDFMLGPLAIPQKKKVVKKQRAREKFDESQKVRPKEIGEDDIQHDEHQTTTLVKHVADILEAKGGPDGMNLFKFIINPESYTQTVENIFYTSFLIKERRAAIDYDEQDEPYIYASLPPDEEQKKEADLKARQLIFEMDMQMWKDAIEAYNITETAIPTRVYREVQKGKWYG